MRIRYTPQDARLREIRRPQTQDLDRPLQLAVLAVEFLLAGSLLGRQAGMLALDALRLPDPTAQRLGRATDLLGDRLGRPPTATRARSRAPGPAVRPLANLRARPARSCHDPILTNNGASAKPGAVQSASSALTPLRRSNNVVQHAHVSASDPPPPDPNHDPAIRVSTAIRDAR